MNSVTASRNAIAALVRNARRSSKVITRKQCNALCLTTGAMGFKYLCSGFYVKAS